MKTKAHCVWVTTLVLTPPASAVEDISLPAITPRYCGTSTWVADGSAGHMRDRIFRGKQVSIERVRLRPSEGNTAFAEGRESRLDPPRTLSAGDTLTIALNV